MDKTVWLTFLGHPVDFTMPSASIVRIIISSLPIVCKRSALARTVWVLGSGAPAKPAYPGSGAWLTRASVYK